jgi:hypothetical protein
MNGMAVRDHRAGAEDKFLTHCRDGCEDQQTLDVAIILAFHAVGLENQVVSHPNRVESIGFSLFRSFDAAFGRSIFAKVRQK